MSAFKKPMVYLWREKGAPVTELWQVTISPPDRSDRRWNYILEIDPNAYGTLRAENKRLRDALRRLRDATPFNTNSASANDAFGFVYAVAATALDEDRVPLAEGAK